MEYNLKLYESILNVSEFTVGFKPIKSFFLSKITNEEESYLKNIQGIEIIYDSLSYNSTEINNHIFSIIKKIEGLYKEMYVRTLNQKRSKIRTYKGVIKGLKDPKIEYIEDEILLEDNQSYFASVIKLETINSRLFEEFFMDSRMNFILLKKKNSHSKLKILTNSGIYDNYAIGINYLKLLTSEYLNHTDILVRCGGDGGRTEISLQFFVNREYSDALLKKLNMW